MDHITSKRKSPNKSPTKKRQKTGDLECMLSDMSTVRNDMNNAKPDENPVHCVTYHAPPSSPYITGITQYTDHIPAIGETEMGDMEKNSTLSRKSSNDGSESRDTDNFLVKNHAFSYSDQVPALCGTDESKSAASNMHYEGIDRRHVLNRQYPITRGSRYSMSMRNVTSDNPYRKQLLWTTAIEEKIKEWYEKCRNNAHIHNSNAKKFKKLHFAIGIPAAIIPLTAVALNGFLGDYPFVPVACLIATGVLTTLQGFFNPVEKQEKHFSYDAQYNELAVEIASELIKPQHNRQEADVFLQKIMDRYNYLNNIAPPL